MSELTAIDILMLPDATMLERAEALNEEMRQSVPEGFALDARHTPHITLLQRYVRSDDLDQAFEVAKSFKPMTSAQQSALTVRVRDAALTGKYELFKTDTRFDGTVRNPQWMV